MQTIHKSEVPIVGESLGGGFYTGIILLDGKQHALVTAPKSAEFKSAWGKYGEKIEGAGHFVDGLKNTIKMADAGLDIAIRVRALLIGGFDDWAIPARNQQEMQYRAFKPTADKNCCSYLDGYNPDSLVPGELYLPNHPAQTTAAPFQKCGAEAFEIKWYWSSTQSSAGYAFSQRFSNGNQLSINKLNECWVRPVRMIQIIN